MISRLEAVACAVGWAGGDFFGASVARGATGVDVVDAEKAAPDAAATTGCTSIVWPSTPLLRRCVLFEGVAPDRAYPGSPPSACLPLRSEGDHGSITLGSAQRATTKAPNAAAAPMLCPLGPVDAVGAFCAVDCPAAAHCWLGRSKPDDDRIGRLGPEPPLEPLLLRPTSAARCAGASQLASCRCRSTRRNACAAPNCKAGAPEVLKIIGRSVSQIVAREQRPELQNRDTRSIANHREVGVPNCSPGQRRTSSASWKRWVASSLWAGAAAANLSGCHRTASFRNAAFSSTSVQAGETPSSEYGSSGARTDDNDDRFLPHGCRRGLGGAKRWGRMASDGRNIEIS
eukprot:SAG31_NODE_8561_length_1430_cov_1.858753_1_plen_344_part_00